MGRIIDLTSKVEVIEENARKFGVEISGIYCSVESDFRRGNSIECNGEIIGTELSESVIVKCSAFDEKGRVLGEGTAYNNRESYSNYDTFSVSFYTRLKPSKCKILILKN